MFVFVMAASLGFAQRVTDKLDRGLVAQKVSGGVFLSWRIYGEEYYDVTYNVYRDGTKINSEPLTVSNYKDTSGTASSTYTVAPVVRGVEQAQCKATTVWASSYKEIKLAHEGIASTLVPNDACCADVDGDGELEILMKFDNLSEIEQAYPKYGPAVNGVVTGEYSIFEVFKQDGTRLWWVNCGPNMGDFQNNEQNIVAYDWDGDGKAEAVFRAADGTIIHMADGTTYTVGNASTNYRAATGGGTNWFMHDGAEYLVYVNGETGKPYQCIAYPLARLESGETDLNKAWGDGYGHRSSKHFFGAPYLDGRKPSIFLARGIYTRHKMIAYDVDPATHTLNVRWKWYNNTNGPWKGQGYHNYAVADVDLDGRDEIVFGSMVIDDNGKGLSTTGLGHGDAEHVGDFNPYIHGLEIYACLEDNPGNNYRDATTSKIYHRFQAGNDDGRAMAGNFCNTYPGALGCSAREGAISLVSNAAVDGMDATGVNTNFRIYWDGDLCEETFNYVNGKNTAGCVVKYGSWSPIYTCEGSLTNNDTKGTPCYQGDIFGDWREEIIMRTADNNVRIYSTPTPTTWRNYTLWHDHQYRNAMVWQMCGYNQPPHVSYFLGELENITMAPPPLTMTGRTEVANGGTIGSALNDQHVIVCETGNTNITIENGVKPYIVTFNVPTWVQGSAASEATTQNTKITYDTYTCDVTGGAIAGTARLIKQGDGVLNLPKVDMTYTGETNIWGGTLNFDGTMKNSDVWLNRFAQLNSDGGEFKSIKADYGAVIRPGGENNQGNITVDGELYLGFGSRLVLDLYGASIQCDHIKAKTLTIEKKVGTIWSKYGPEYIQPVLEINGIDLAAGEYVIAEADSISGNITNLKIEGVANFKTGLKYEDGKVILTLGDTRGASDITWMGSASSVWDFATSQNFVVSDDETATPDVFVVGDVVEFTDNASRFNITLTGDLAPSEVVVNNTKAYTFVGTGAITSGSLTKAGTGNLTINNSNSYTGGNRISGGTVIVSSLANDITPTGNLGGVTSTTTKFVIENGAALQTTAAVTNGSPIRFDSDEGGVINATADFTQQKMLTGTLLTKKGSGCLKTATANTSLKRLVIAGGSVAAQGGNPAAVVELQSGTLWDDAQATSHEINVPAGKSGTWDLTYTYYTNYTNKLTGGGTLTIVPRNTVSRVRISGNWSEFTGTIKHTNTNIWLPLDNSSGLPNGTLDIATGCTVTNVCKTFKIGKLTGNGSLAHPIANFQNSSAVSGSNTWQVGNSSEALGDFTFPGTITDGGGTNKANFEKIGTCKMTISGAWTNSGTVKVSAGELALKSGAQLGSGALTVNSGATLSGVTKSGAPLSNSSATINGTLQIGSSATAVTGSIDFGGKNVTFGSNSKIIIGLRKCATTAPQNSYINNVGTLKVNSGATIAAYLGSSYTPTIDEAVPDSFYVWFNTANATVGELNFELPELPVYNYWDTSKIAEGKLLVRCDKEKYDAYVVDIKNIEASETVTVEVINASGTVVDEFTSPMSDVQSAFGKAALPKGVYLLRVQSDTGKRGLLKLMK